MISVIISVLAFLLSLYAAINTYYEKHRKLRTYIRWGYWSNAQLNAQFLFTNLSTRPITITKIKIRDDCNSGDNALYPIELLSTGPRKAFSDDLPITVPPRSSAVCIIAFQYLDAFTLNQEFYNFDLTVDGKSKLINHLRVEKYLTTKQLTLALENRMQ